MRALVPSMTLALVAACASTQQRPAGATTAGAPTAGASAQQSGRPQDTEVWTPVPKVVDPGPGPATPAPPPSDAIVLFDGTSLDEWTAVVDTGAPRPAGWTVANGIVTVNKRAGNIQTKRRFTSYQLHLEWRTPEGITGTGQGRANSGIFLASTGAGDAGYEIQILDSFNNATYVNGMVGSIYKQAIPLANASRPPGQWQTYDIVWTAPTFDASGAVRTPAYVTAFHNGVLVEDHFQLRGQTQYIGQPSYRPHGPSPIKLQAHGDPSPPISFRNIWVRPL